MAQHRCLLLWAACALAAIVPAAAASATSSNHDGICVRVKQYVVGNGRRALDGTTVTYCGGESDCHRWPDQGCCDGFRRDPNSKKLRCIKVNTTETASIGAVGGVADLNSAESSAPVRDVWNYLKRVDFGQKNVRRPRDSENAPADQSGLNVASSRGPAQTPPQREGQTNSGNVAGSASGDTSQSSTDGKQLVGPLNSGAGDTQPKTNTASGALLPATSNNETPPTTPQEQPVGSPTKGTVETQPKSNSASGAPLPPTSIKDTPPTTPQNQPIGSPTNRTNDTQPKSNIMTGAPVPATSNKDTPPTTPEKQPVGPPTNGAGVSQPKTNSAIGTPLPATSDKGTLPTNPQTPPVGPSTNGASDIQPKTNSTSGAPIPATSEILPSSPQKASSSSGAGSDSSQVSSKNAPASMVSQLGVNPSQPVVPSHVDPPVNVQPQPTNNASNPSASAHSEIGLQPAAKDDHNNQHGDTNPVPPTLTTSGNHGVTTPAVSPTTLLPVSTSTSSVHPQGNQPVPPQGPTSGTTATTTSPVAATPTESSGSGRIVAPTGDNTTAVSTAEHASSTAQSTQDVGSLELTSKDLEHGQRVDTIPSPASIQPTSTQAVPITSNSTVANITTKLPLPVPTVNTTHVNESHPQSVNTTHPAQEGTRDNNVPSAPPIPPGNTNTTSINTTTVAAATATTATTAATTITQPTQSISHGSTEPNATSVPATQHPNSKTDKNYNSYNVAVETKGSSTPATITTSNSINQTATSQTSTAAPVAKPLGEKPRGGGAMPSGRSASQTASEVTISLLLVAAVAFVAALLYWRARRRRRQYVNCGTREPNHFSNPVYDLEAMMEQTSLVKLQDAADVEDGELNEMDHEAASPRK